MFVGASMSSTRWPSILRYVLGRQPPSGWLRPEAVPLTLKQPSAAKRSGIILLETIVEVDPLPPERA